MIAIFITISVFTCAALWALIRVLVQDSYKQGYRHGHLRGTFDASKQQVDTERFFRNADNTQFPHKN